MDDLSDSAKFRITSRNDGIDPVVKALIRGIVIVGDIAWAVNGIAAPDLINLPNTLVRELEKISCYLGESTLE